MKQPLTSKQAADLIYREQKPLLGECFCGQGESIDRNTPMYIQLVPGHETSVPFSLYSSRPLLSNQVNIKDMQKPCVVFKLQLNDSRHDMTWSFIIDDHHSFNYMEKGVHERVLNILLDAMTHMDFSLSSYALIPEDMKKILLKQMALGEGSYVEVMDFSRSRPNNARELLDNHVVNYVKEKFAPGSNISIFSHGSGQLGQEAIITLRLMSLGYHVHFHCYDVAYREIEGSMSPAVLMAKFYEVVNSHRQQLGLSDYKVALSFYDNLHKQQPAHFDIFMVCDPEVRFFPLKTLLAGNLSEMQRQKMRISDEEMKFARSPQELQNPGATAVGGKMAKTPYRVGSLREDLEGLMTEEKDVYMACALKNECHCEVNGFLVGFWSDIKLIDNVEVLSEWVLSKADMQASMSQEDQKPSVHPSGCKM